MTLASDGSWSCRLWDRAGTPEHGESVRVVGTCFQVTWNDRLRPPPPVTDRQTRTVSAWGEIAQASLARLRVLVVGAGSVGLDVALRLAATGIVEVGVLDFDTLEIVNLDRMIGATFADVRLARGKAEVAARLMKLAATAAGSGRSRRRAHPPGRSPPCCPQNPTGKARPPEASRSPPPADAREPRQLVR